MEFNKPTEEFIQKLQEAVPGRVYTGEDINDDYTHDELKIHGKYYPDAVVVVKSTEEVSAVCKLCYEYEIPIIPRGAGTGLSGGCVATAGGVMIDLQKMNKLFGIDPENMVVRAEAGVLIDTLQQACSDAGFLYPPDPGEKFATVGGNVATNAGGMRACKYGTSRQFVKTLTVVMPDGEILHVGAEVSKNSSGYSLTDLFCSSEGTLGIITEVSMRIMPKPVQVMSLLAPFADVDTCIHCVSAIKRSGLDPQCLEFMDRDNVLAVHKYLDKVVYPTEIEGVPAEAYLLVNFEAFSDDEAGDIMERAADVFLEGGALDVIVYDSPSSLANAWLVRGSILESILEDYEYTEETDAVVPVGSLAEFIIFVASLRDEYDMDIRMGGHAGDGNLHINFCANGITEEEFEEKMEVMSDRIYEKAFELKGLVSGEHGIGNAKVDRLAQNVGQAQMDLMYRIKQACDPKMLLNPGKVCYTI